MRRTSFTLILILFLISQQTQAATSYICGFEMGHLGEAFSSTGTVAVNATAKRTGTHGLRVNPTAGAASYVTFSKRPTGGVLTAFAKSFRFYLRIIALPDGTSNIVVVRSGAANVQHINLQADGKLAVYADPTNFVNTTLALSNDGLFHLIELEAGYNAGAGARLWVDGSIWASDPDGTPASGDGLRLGEEQGASNRTCDLYFDDLVVDDGDVRIGSGQAILLKAVSDNSIGTWTGGADGTTNLFEALNNIPPAGLATPTNISQIKNANGSANQDGTFNVQSYTAGGIGASDTINAVMAICNDGEAVSTGTKDGATWIATNPTQSGTVTFDYGNDVDALGNFPSFWATHVGPVTASPSVTKGTQPTVTIRKTTATTRVTHADFLGLYVDYTPGAPGGRNRVVVIE